MSKQVLSFQWDIKNFNDSDLVYNEFFESQRFSTSDATFKSEWKLKLYPNLNAYEWNKANRNIALKLLRLDSGPEFPVKCSISFLNNNGCRMGSINSNVIRTCFLNPNRDVHQGTVLDTSNYTEEVIDNGTLSILCEIKMRQNRVCTELVTEKQRVHMRGTSSLIKNMNGSINVQISRERNWETIFYLSYGSAQLKLQIRNQPWTFIYLITEYRPEILMCRVSICRADDGNRMNIINISPTRAGRRINWSLKGNEKTATFVITPRCLIESMPDAYLYEPVTAIVRELRTRIREKIWHPQFGDISINVEGITVRAHKDILGYHSPVFATMFRENSNQDNIAVQVFQIETILDMIEYIYIGDGHEEYEKFANPLELLRAADKFQLKNLKKTCEKLFSDPANIFASDRSLQDASLVSGKEKRTNGRANFLQPQFGDISIEVDGHILRAHKDLLSFHSPVFSTMFNETWCGEGTQVVKFSNFDFETILAMVEYIYFGGIDEFPEGTDAAELLKAADLYQLELLKNKCEAWLCKDLDKNNVLSRLALSNTYDLPHLKNAALCFPVGTLSQYYK